MDDADALLAFYDSYGALLTERQVEHTLHPRLRILEQPYDLAPKLFSICQLCEEYEHLLSRRRLAELCKAAADQNWKLVQARLLRTTRQLELYCEVWEIEQARLPARPEVLQLAHSKYLLSEQYQRKAISACGLPSLDNQQALRVLEQVAEEERRASC